MFNGFYAGKRVLVTGNTGFKGAWLSEWLLSLGAEVTGYSIDIPTTPSLFEKLNHKERMNHVEGDILDLAHFKKVVTDVKPEIVFHLAAQSLVRLSYDQPVDTFETNVMGTVKVMEALRESPSLKSLLIITTDKCYENREWEFGYRENDPMGGKDPYSASKGCAELAFSAYYRSFFSTGKTLCHSVRAGNVIGGGDWALDRIVPDCAKAWGQGKPVEIRNPVSVRPWQHVLEPLSGYLWLASRCEEQKELQGESFNFGPRVEVNQPVGVLVKSLQKYWPETESKIASPDPLIKPEAGLLKLVCDKAFHHLKWRPTLGFEETMEMTAKWYRSFYVDQKDARDLVNEDIRSYSQKAADQQMEWA
ncbi:MAG: CDP-glucose 4,6-dehydratase [Bdellovibrionaceae bacterium]|nr:CDP-glucose 4,6-dehydratase [Pseudobdellovibrionaceae bacterium]|tara:strand:+ start:364 stop:1449 length:1086 start_codon:yes stop_codon:yes gene_type:complete